LGVVLVLIGHIILKHRLDHQNARIAFLNKEILVLDGKIEQIKRIRQEIDALKARKEEVEKLQESRTETVHMLDEFARLIPDGLYLKTIKQTGKKVLLEGFAQSNARISTLMENLERSPWFGSPELLESKQVTLNAQRVYEFSLDIRLSYDPNQDTQKTDSAALVSVPASGAEKGGANNARPAVLAPTMAGQSGQSGMVAKPTPLATPPSTPMPASAGQDKRTQLPPQTNMPPVMPPVLETKKGAPIPAMPSAPGMPSGMKPTGEKNGRPSTVLGLPTPQSVANKVSESLSTGQKRSMP
jgi:type IV pilus assembly protein PilN